MENLGCHDLQAENYDSSVKKNIHDYIRENYFYILDKIAANGNFHQGMKVLDIGVGTGLLMEKMPANLDLYGIDISEKMMDKLLEKGLPVKLCRGDFCNIPFLDKTFDKIVSTFAFHHVTSEKKQIAFSEMTRVLKQGGSLIIGDFMFENQEQKKSLIEKFHRENRQDMLEELENEYFTDLEEACKMLNKIGYKTRYERASTLSWILTAENQG